MSDANNVLSKKFIVPKGSVVVPHVFDTRVVDKNISLGRVTRSEYEKHLSSLPDETASASIYGYNDLLSHDSNGSSH